MDIGDVAMTRLFAFILALVCVYGIALAKSDKAHGQRGGFTTGHGVCSNKLDFTQACNSQYMGIF